MNETLKALCDIFYQPLALTEEKQEIKDCHRQLIERLDKPERKLVLRIIDAKDRTAELLSIDSFISGFQLAWRLSNELNIREKQHPIMTRKSVRSDAVAILEETEGEIEI